MNTKYFHAFTKVHKKHMKIERLKNDKGVWMEDDKQLQQMLMNFLKNLFLKDTFQFNGYPIHNFFSKLKLKY